jgi:hypothetical protein
VRGLEVGAYDPAPTSEAFTRRFIDKAWPTLEKLKPSRRVSTLNALNFSTSRRAVDFRHYNGGY